MKYKKFNFIVSLSAFILGTIFVFSDGAGLTANVIGASGDNAGVTALIGIAMIIGAIGLFIVSMYGTDNHSIKLEQLLRRTRNHEELYEAPKKEQDVEMHKAHDVNDSHHNKQEAEE